MSELDARLRQIDLRHKQDRNLMLAVLVVGIIVQGLLFFFVVQPPTTAPPHMEFRGVTATGPTALCPGETLRYTATMRVTQPGIYDNDVSVWRVTPPATVLWSETGRMVISEPIAYTLAREWVVPAMYLDPTTRAPVRWQPGRYERRHGLSSVGPALQPSVTVLPFAIREDCP